jgi:hypothetical protein
MGAVVKLLRFGNRILNMSALVEAIFITPQEVHLFFAAPESNWEADGGVQRLHSATLRDIDALAFTAWLKDNCEVANSREI